MNALLKLGWSFVYFREVAITKQQRVDTRQKNICTSTLPNTHFSTNKCNNISFITGIVLATWKGTGVTTASVKIFVPNLYIYIHNWVRTAFTTKHDTHVTHNPKEILTNSMVYETRRLIAAFTRALQ